MTIFCAAVVVQCAALGSARARLIEAMKGGGRSLVLHRGTYGKEDVRKKFVKRAIKGGVAAWFLWSLDKGARQWEVAFGDGEVVKIFDTVDFEGDEELKEYLKSVYGRFDASIRRYNAFFGRNIVPMTSKIRVYLKDMAQEERPSLNEDDLAHVRLFLLRNKENEIMHHDVARWLAEIYEDIEKERPGFLSDTKKAQIQEQVASDLGITPHQLKWLILIKQGRK